MTHSSELSSEFSLPTTADILQNFDELPPLERQLETIEQYGYADPLLHGMISEYVSVRRSFKPLQTGASEEEIERHDHQQNFLMTRKSILLAIVHQSIEDGALKIEEGHSSLSFAAYYLESTIASIDDELKNTHTSSAPSLASTALSAVDAVPAPHIRIERMKAALTQDRFTEIVSQFGKKSVKRLVEFGSIFMSGEMPTVTQKQLDENKNSAA